MKKILPIILLVAMVPYLAWGQSSEPFVFHQGATANADGNILNASYYSTIVVQIEGTFTGEVFFEKKTKDASGWVGVQCTNAADRSVSATSATAVGYWECPGGTWNFRARVTRSSGTIIVTGHGTTAVSRSSGGGGGGSGTVTSVSASGGVETTTGSAITGSGTIRSDVCVRTVTIATDTILSTDRNCIVRFTNAGGTAVTLPQAGTAGFDAGFSFKPLNDSAGIVTITPVTSEIQGAADLDINAGKGIEVSNNGTDYFYQPGLGLTVETQGLGDVITINRTFGGAVSQATSPQFGSGATGRYWLLYDDPTDGLMFVCEVAGVANDCNYVRKLASGKYQEFQDSTGASILKLDSTAVTFGKQAITSNLGIEFTESDTNPTCAAGNYGIYADLSETKLKKCQNGTATDLDTSGGGSAYATVQEEGSSLTQRATVNFIGSFMTCADNSGSSRTDCTIALTLPSEQWFNTTSCQNTSAGLVFDTTTTGPQALCDTGSNTQKGYAAFDASTDEAFYGHWVLPTGFTGSINIKGKYKIAATTGAVGWCFQMVRVPDGSTSDPALPAQASGNCTSDTVKGTTLQENDFTITGATCTSCAAGDHVYWRLSRDADGSAVTDSATGDAFLYSFGRVWNVSY